MILPPGRGRTLVVAAILALAAWIVFRPGLTRVFAGDQVWYFAELHGRTSLGDGLRVVDYAIARTYWRGDEGLFRPLLFATLAVENTLFSYHHVWWNVANLAFHVLVGLSLYRLLMTIRPSPWAAAGALLFLVMKPVVGLVLWNHIGGYLLATVMLLEGARLTLLLVREPDAPSTPRRLAGFAAVFFAGALFHEVNEVLAFVAAVLVVLAWRRAGRALRAARVTALFAPAVVYAGLYVWHASRASRFWYVDQGEPLTLTRLPRLLYHTGRALALWVRHVVMPPALQVEGQPFGGITSAYRTTWGTAAEWTSALLTLVLLVLAIRAFSRRDAARALPALVVVAAAPVVLVAILAVGRNVMGIPWIVYYAYFMCAPAVAWAYALVDFDRLSGRWRAAAVAAAASLIIFDAADTMGTVREIGLAEAEPSAYFARVEAFVDAHRAEPGFTFALTPHDTSLDPDADLILGYPSDPGAPIEPRRVSQSVFAKYYAADRPRYIFDGATGAVVAAPPR